MSEQYLITVVARNSPGVISRVSGLLRRKLFNIESMTAGRTHLPDVSRFTVVIKGDLDQAHKAAKLIDRLIEVRSVKILQREHCVRREIVLARFRVGDVTQAQLLAKLEANLLSKEIEHENDIVTLELIDTSQNLDIFLAKIQDTDIEILDWVRSGVIALEK